MATEAGKTVLILGAGFTRAFLPSSPLLTDFYDTGDLIERFANFPHAKNVLEREIGLNNGGRINLERLMTRLDGLMPYDHEMNADIELALLLAAIKAKFRQKLTAAKQDAHLNEPLLQALARSCVDRHINCVTFNYDDVFDEYLWRSYGSYSGNSGTDWHPDGGYGFYCRPGVCCVNDISTRMDRVPMMLLKLHGSINWRVRRGSRSPSSVNDVLHHEDWYKAWELVGAEYSDIERHLESEPFMVPPVLTKASLVREPVLRLIWHLAYDVLGSAQRLIFVGYSFPPTDLAARFLFQEALHWPSRTIEVVNFAEDEEGIESVTNAYSAIFPTLERQQFDFGGAVEWAGKFIEQ